jgi:very-short-patch-repair endonuclease
VASFNLKKVRIYMPKIKTHEKFLIQLNKVNPNVEVKSIYKNAFEKVLCKCKLDGYEWFATPSNLTNISNPTGCPLCSNSIVKSGINDIWTLKPEIAKLLLNPQDGYMYHPYTKKKLQWVCPECKNIVTKSGDRVSSNGLVCGRCSDGISYPNKFMYNVLLQSKIEFNSEKSFNWCTFVFKNKKRTGRYDFYFEKNYKKYIIEMDGGFHYKNNLHNGQTKEESLYLDREKDRLATENGIKVIRIDSSISTLDYLKVNILQSDLSKIIDLNKINWDECNTNSLKSNVIIACNYWNSGIHNTTQIGSLMNLNRITIVRYLTKCASSGLCDYLNKNTMKQSANEARKKQVVPVICITTGEEFPSIEDAKRKYNAFNIRLCCLNKRQHSGQLNNGIRLRWKFKNKLLNEFNKGVPISVNQYTLDNQFIQNYKSIRQATALTNINKKSISQCCKGKQKTAGGYIWTYTKELTDKNTEKVS